MSYIDKVVIVTGSSAGIGAAIAIKFSEKGAKVVIVGRNQTNLQNVAAKCKKSLIVAADITKDEDCKRIIDETIKHFGRLDVLVNNVGVYKEAVITSEDAMQVFDEVISVNLRSIVYITHLAAKYLIETQGNIINISSIAAMCVLRLGSFPYCTSKAALNHWTRAIALDFASDGVRVNAVNLGPVRTGTADEATWEMYKDKTALQRVSNPEEVADLVLFLASDKAVAITGSSFVSDNGFLLKSSM